MIAKANKLAKLTLGQMVLINSAVITVFIIVNSIVCGDGLIGGECVKDLDSRIFIIQMINNILFAVYYLYKIDKSKWGILILNAIVTTVIFIIAATLHSISKAGLF